MQFLSAVRTHFGRYHNIRRLHYYLPRRAAANIIIIINHHHRRSSSANFGGTTFLPEKICMKN